MWTHDIADKVLIVGADEQALQTLQAQLELSGLRGRIAVADDELLSAGHASSRPLLIIWLNSLGGGTAVKFVDAMIAEGVSLIAIGAVGRSRLPGVDAVLHADYTVPALLETVGRFVNLPRPADVISMDRKRGELVDEEACYHDLFDRASDAILLIDHDTHVIIEVNQQAEALYGYGRSELIGMSLLQIVPSEEHADIWRNIRHVDTSGESAIHVSKRTHLRQDGSRLTVGISVSLLTCRGRRIFQDIVRDETEHFEREHLLEQILDSAPDPTVIVDADGNIQFVNRQLQAVFGYTRDELLDRPVEILVPERLAAGHERHRDNYNNDPQPRQMGSGLELCGQTKDGHEIPIEVSLAPVRDNDRRLVAASIRDITERKLIRDALQESEGRLKALFDHAPTEIHFKDCEGRYVLLNRHVERLLGVPAADVIGKTPGDVLSEDRAHHFTAHDRRVLETGETQKQRDRWQTSEGERTYLTIKFPVRDEDGSITGIGAMGTDITAIERAEEQLRKSHEVLEGQVEERTRELERQQEVLRQAQKMEAIGQLTGGVAHDFNNLLTAILGNLEMLEAWHGGEERSSKAISQAQEAADLGAELTGRLLAFARRQPLDPKVTSFSDVVFEMNDLLSRTLGETIEINTVLANPLDKALVDPVQLQNALLNLAINARDAMQGGGRLTIETANVELDEDYARDYTDVNVGDYVLLSVTDTGIGMAPEILEHVFEPFFTTKSIGKGSGLGLSMVYGFVKQSGGHIRLYSESGRGTAINLYFPKALGLDETTETTRAEETMPKAHGEVVLVVEDEPRVRQVTVQRLETLGYTVLEAENGPAALDLLAGPPVVDLVFTDMIMPGGMSGGDLAREVERLYPEIKIMLTSGYADHAGIDSDAALGGKVWLRKPYRLAELARKIRDVLDD